MDVLVVCTANQCRSPLIVAALVDRLAAVGAGDVSIASAGLLPPGPGATEPIRAAAADAGLDLADHGCRELDARQVRQADLVIGAARNHVREAIVLDPSARSRAFTLIDLARRAAASGPRPPGEPFEDWLEQLAADRSSADLLGDDPNDDLPDPTGRGRGAHRALVADVLGLVERLVPLGWPAAAAEGTPRS